MKPKQTTLILDALQEYGPMTTTDLEAIVDLPVKTVSAWCSELASMGILVRLKKRVRYTRADNGSEVGCPSFIYKLNGDMRSGRFE